MMTLADQALAYNREIKDALETLYSALPPGQQQTVLKQAAVKAMLEKYKVLESEDDNYGIT